MTAYIKKGFTLIELLIVMAILGVLAVIVLVAINPVEQLARARDTGRISAVQQLGRAVVSYYTSNQQYPLGASWSTDITASGDLNTFPTSVSTADAACGTNAVNGYCYNVATVVNTNDQAVVYSQLISQQQINKCAAGQTPYSVFSTFDGRGGVTCGAAEPAAGVTLTYF
jgi:type IV pilus assembly protein PilA